MVALEVPYSDPFARPPVVRDAMRRALAGGADFAYTLDVVEVFCVGREHPVVLVTHVNPLRAFGLELACERASEVGVDALLVADVPREHIEEIALYAQESGLDLIGLVSSATDPRRIERVAEHASGFMLYWPTTTTLADPALHIAATRTTTGLPVAIAARSYADGLAVSDIADAVFVADPLVTEMARALPVEAPYVAEQFVSSMKTALAGQGPPAASATAGDGIDLDEDVSG